MKTRILGILIAEAILLTGFYLWSRPTPSPNASAQAKSVSHTAPEVKPNPLAQTPDFQMAALPQKKLQTMSEAEINQFLAQLKDLSLQQRIDRVSAQALNTPYVLGPLGEGKDAPYDKDPLIDLKRVDCVTFCEQTLALALSPNYKSAFNTLQKIRYKQGEIKMECRNHYTMADWVPNNDWLLRDITAQLPGHAWLKQTISHRELFASQNFQGIQVREPDRALQQAYIPEDKIMAILPKLKSGDIGVLIMNYKGIFAAHTGFMIQQATGQWVYRNATSIGPKQVVDTSMPDLIANLKKSQRLVGMAFVRPRPEALQGR